MPQKYSQSSVCPEHPLDGTCLVRDGDHEVDGLVERQLGKIPAISLAEDPGVALAQQTFGFRTGGGEVNLAEVGEPDLTYPAKTHAAFRPQSLRT